ncbi:MAG: M28 family peptidase [Desulfuromonadales bacterium]|nr:M28 family peptidase [Desulfuromonadales bacterium]
MSKTTTILTSLARIAITLVLALVALVACLWLALRQPNWGEHPFANGARADRAALRQHVKVLCNEYSPRNPRHLQQLNAAADYIKRQLSLTNAKVSEQAYLAGGVTCRNIIARFGPDTGPLLVVGAHYDVYGDLPGADDNASGVAGVLELARLLQTRKLTAPVELVAFSTEEPPFFGGAQMGSAVHAQSLAERKIAVSAMISLEMIGYFTDGPVHLDPPLNFIYPESGNFVVAAGRWQDRKLAKEIKKLFRGANDLPCFSYSGPTMLGADLSDHRSYWPYDIPAVMVTDTAHLRNHNYHTPNDTPDTLDYARMADVVDGVLSAVIHLSANPDTP